jgi:hypothetical protein
MHILVMILQASGFAVEVLVILSLLGFGLTAWSMPEAGIGLLLTPVVGLAVAAIGFQLFTPIAPPWLTLLVLVVILGLFSLWMGWRRRMVVSAVIRRHAVDIFFTTAAGLGLYLALLTHVFGARFFTLAGWPSDNVFLYAPAGEFLRTHAFNAANSLALVDNPTTRYLALAARIFPNSVGPLDGAISMLSGWQVFALFDPLSALLYALAVPAMYVLLAWFGLSRPARMAAVLLLTANQLLFWVMGQSFQQEMEAMPIFIAALALTIRAVTSERHPPAVLAGLVAGSLLGIYLPIFVIYVICALGYVVIAVVQRGLVGRLAATLRQLLWLVGGGLATTAVSLYWLLPGGGLYYWTQLLGTKIQAGGISSFYPVRYLLGMAPVADPWGRPYLLPLLWWRPSWNTASHWLAWLVAVLMLAGLTSFALKRDLPPVGLFIAAGLYLAYLQLVSQYPYGLFKTVGYLLPLTSALIAAGAVEFVPAIGQMVARRREFELKQPPSPTLPGNGAGNSLQPAMQGERRFAMAAGIVCLAVVFAVETVNAIEMEHMWLKVGPQAFPASFKALVDMASRVPHGSGVLQINPSPAYHDGIKYAAARYFLTDDNLLLLDHIPPATAVPFRFDYMIVPWPLDPVTPGSGFTRVWGDAEVGLALYQRVAASGAG